MLHGVCHRNVRVLRIDVQVHHVFVFGEHGRYHWQEFLINPDYEPEWGPKATRLVRIRHPLGHRR
jgi:hypothetical protein